MREYLDLVKYVLDSGEIKDNRTGVRTLSTFNYNYKIDVRTGFPLLTTKKMFFKSVVMELLWYLRGSSNLDFLQKHGVNFWNPWKSENSNETPTQYHYFTKYPDYVWDVDQLKWVIEELQKNPYSRRLIISLWHPPVALLSKISGHLPPCGFVYCFNVQNNKNVAKNTLNLHLTQRSCDLAVGCPQNIATSSLLLYLVSHIVGIQSGFLAHSIVDAHIYAGKKDNDPDDHRPNLKKQLMRIPKAFPILYLGDKLKTYEGLLDLARGDYSTEEIMSQFVLENYNPEEFLKFSAIV